MHGDTVYAERVYGRSDDEAEVVKILSRGYTEIVGTFRKDSRAGYLIPDEKKYFENIYIPLSRCFNIPDGVKRSAKSPNTLTAKRRRRNHRNFRRRRRFFCGGTVHHTLL